MPAAPSIAVDKLRSPPRRIVVLDEISLSSPRTGHGPARAERSGKTTR